MMGHMQQSRPSNLSPYPPPGTPPSYYGVYPADSMTNEDAMPPTAFQSSPYPEQFTGDMGAEPPEHEHSNSKSYAGEESGGEFGGLVSYFSSQREDDLESYCNQFWHVFLKYL
ncbi:hypothetical protein NQ318_016895 [Aromia moschata]|uniref:Uncharacterized protein n=1 Tax=Aromia moschata TaxID=1265417 RepID=A0AAV8XS43_9CUCU|nr:hypothetical protein NQ318_016895 [Aromia moschata]